jgi:formamidopyrimidine-DNA glycosylase
MPELPEVESIAATLRKGNEEQPSLLGMKIANTKLLWERSLSEPSPGEFHERMAGQTITEISRRGKFLRFALSSGDTLLIHLRMSGDILVEPTSKLLAPHHRMIIQFDNGWRLAFNDTRKFGRVWLTSQPETVLGSLGPEPLDETFSPEDFYRRLHSRHRQLKPLLLDQSFLAGLGNIYTDEALHMAKLHPLSLSDSVTFEQAEYLLESIRSVLKEGIYQNGASIDWVYRGGGYQDYFRVYRRTGEPCPVCGAVIQHLVVGQRSTHYCPVCQPEEGQGS